MCSGSLSARTLVDGIVDLDGTAIPEDPFVLVEQRYRDETFGAGDSVVIEATCTDAAGAEAGFIRIEGRVTEPPYNGVGGATYVSSPEDQGVLECFAGTESRGSPPCVFAYVVAPEPATSSEHH